MNVQVSTESMAFMMNVSMISTILDLLLQPISDEICLHVLRF